MDNVKKRKFDFKTFLIEICIGMGMPVIFLSLGKSTTSQIQSWLSGIILASAMTLCLITIIIIGLSVMASFSPMLHKEVLKMLVETEEQQKAKRIRIFLKVFLFLCLASLQIPELSFVGAYVVTASILSVVTTPLLERVVSRE